MAGWAARFYLYKAVVQVSLSSIYVKTLTIKPDYAKPHYCLSGALARQKTSANGKAHLNRALKITPDYAAAANAANRSLATLTDPAICNAEETSSWAERAFRALSEGAGP